MWDAKSLIVLLLVGAIAGWLAGTLVRGFGFGLIGNILVGIVGALIGTWLMTRLNIRLASGAIPIASILNATIGAVLLLLVIGLVRRR
jgi:uncharacterized membrane protein YeaQ/YmgE (transglycosylase-associated protein family)